MEPTGPFLLPRPVPTSASVIYQKPQFPFKMDLSSQPIGCAIVRPTVEDTLTLLEDSSTPNVVGIGQTAILQIENYQGGVQDWSTAPAFIGSAGVPVTTVYDFVDGTSYYRGAGSTGMGTLYFAQETDLAAGPLFLVSVSSTNYIGEIDFSLVAVDDSVSPPTKVTLPFTGSGLVPVNTGMHALSLAANHLGVKWSLIGNFTHYQPGCDLTIMVQLTQQLSFQAPGGNAPAWRTYSMWDLLGTSPGKDAVRQQYQTSQRTCVTAFSVLLRNTTAALFKSGSIVAGQMTGGTESQLPSDPEDFYTFVASLNDPKVYSGQLNKGLHWFFAAEKIQDMFFTTKPYNNARPFAVIAWQGVASGDVGDILGLAFDFRINIECLTNNISMMKFVPSSDPLNLVELYLTLVSSHNPFSENPGHMKKIANILRKISQNPLVREAATRMVKAGVEMIPLALAMV